VLKSKWVLGRGALVLDFVAVEVLHSE
jgi:hypothetical protein